MSFALNSITTLLEVFDLPKSIAFYRDVLGFKLIRGDDAWWAMLSRDGVTLMLNTAYEAHERPAMPDPARIKAHADTELYFQCEDLDGIYQHLKKKGCDVKPPVTRSYGMKQVTIKDPDGFVLCFQWPVSKQ